MNAVQLQFYLAIIETPAERDKFDEIYHTYRHTMHHVAMGILHDYHLAEDATHEAFLRIAKNMRKIEEVNVPTTKAFVVIIVRNVSLTMLKKHNMEMPEDDIEEFIQEPTQIEDNIFNRFEFERVLNAISELPRIYRDTLFLHYVRELSASEIAGILQVQRETVKKRMQRGKQLLLDTMKGV